MHHALATALSVALLSTPSGDLLLSTGDPAPPFSMRDLKRQMFSVGNHVGQAPEQPRKAMLMAFFATWCEPCKKEMPILKRIHRLWGPKGVEVLYVGLSQGARDLGPFVEEEKIPWRVIPDAFGLLGRRYGAVQLPHVFILDKEGKIGFQHRGIAPELRKLLDGELARITGESVPEDTEEPAVIAPSHFTKSIEVGRPPSDSMAADRWQPLATFIGEHVRANVTVTSEVNYAAYEQALVEGKYAVANAGPVLSHRVRKEYEPVARIERQGTPTYLGLIFTLRGSPVRSLSQLKGKTIGLVSEFSTSGGVYPRLALIDAGLNLRRDVSIKWLGSHTAVARAVKAGEVDAGACYEDCRDAVWDGTRAKAVATRVLAYTDEIPSEMLLVKRGLDSATKKALTEAVLKLHDTPGILTQMSQGELPISSVVAASDADLEGVGQALTRVKQEGP